jgi:hypothetical protein
MYGKGLSLNVHVALAVVLYHIRHNSNLFSNEPLTGVGNEEDE